LEARQSEPSVFSEAYQAALQAIRSANATDLDAIEDRVFSTSFSELGDDLNQWVLYGAKGKGMALGFDFERIQMLEVPFFYHTPTGDLVAVPATVSGTDTQIPFEWGAYVQPVRYGDAEREKAINEVFWQIEQICGPNDVGTTAQKVVNSIFRIPQYLSMLALVKNDGFKNEHEWRLTTSEHFGDFSGSLLSALSQVEGYQFYGQGPLMTVNVLFRDGGSRGFRPYTKIPFDKAALVEVVLGPAVDAERVTLSTRRLLDRYGFRHTKIVASTKTYRPD
jgi:hypothetical protein